MGARATTSDQLGDQHDIQHFRFDRALSNEQQALLDQTRLLFDFDRAGLRPEHQAIIEAHARHLLANPEVQITLEGHADERGTREYNLALGERRAITVEDALLMQGVPRK